MALRPRRSKRWTPAAIAVGIALMLLGGWAFFAPLVAPMFNFGFFTGSTWSFSSRHLALLLAPGAATFLGGLLLATRRRGGALLAFLGGAWLLAGPSLHQLWGSAVEPAGTRGDATNAVLEIAYFYGTGGLILYFTGLANGLLARRPVVDEMPVIEETPIERTEPVTTHV